MPMNYSGYLDLPSLTYPTSRPLWLHRARLHRQTSISHASIRYLTPTVQNLELIHLSTNMTKGSPRLQPTHFLCLPLLTPTSTPQLTRSLAQLISATSTSPSSRPSSTGDGGDAGSPFFDC